MSNVLLAYDNAVTAGLFFDPWPSSYDPALFNLRTANLGEKWVTNGLASTDTRFQFSIAFGSTTPVALFALCSHNLSLTATVQITGSNNGFSTTVFNSGVLPAFPAGTTATSRRGLRWNFWHRLSTPTACAGWRVAITDSSNPAGFVSVGRLFAAQRLWQPTVNINAGASIGFEGGADVQTALNGAESFTERESFRVARLQLGAMPLDEMLSSAFDLQQVASGSQREVMFIYDPADGVHSVRRSFFGRLRQLSPIEEPQPLALQTAFEVKELL